MRTIAVRAAKVTYPTGNKNFAVKTGFPAAFPAEESDPFLMCDYFGPEVSKGQEKGLDNFPVAWHPHRGMDIVTYLTQGVGRHADSLGNRGTFASPGMQWISVGSGIEHAEGGGTPTGQVMEGFQIWINVPSSQKMNDPRYGVEPPENIAVLEFADGVTGRLLAGALVFQGHNYVGPFQTVQPVEIIDFDIKPGAEYVHTLADHYDNSLGFVYGGDGVIGESPIRAHQVIHLDAEHAAPASNERNILLRAAPGNQGSLKVILFSGVRLRQPIAWHGPFVMTTDEEIAQTLQDYRTGKFFHQRADWDYKRIVTAPTELQEEWRSCNAFAAGASSAGDL